MTAVKVSFRWRNCGDAVPARVARASRTFLGNVYKNPAQPLPAAAFELVRIGGVGGYAIQPVWADGHTTGIYSFDYLKRITREDSSG